MPLPVTVTPNPVHVPVAMFVMPDVFFFQDTTIMASGLMRRPVELNPVRNRQHVMKLWRCFRAGKTHDTGQSNYNKRSFQHFLLSQLPPVLKNVLYFTDHTKLQNIKVSLNPTLLFFPKFISIPPFMIRYVTGSSRLPVSFLYPYGYLYFLFVLYP